MSFNVVNKTPYLRTSREFPEELDSLTEEVSKAYIDTANVVNVRSIGIYPKNRPAVNGKTFYVTSKKQQGLQQLYTFKVAGNIPHGLNLKEVAAFIQCYGAFTDGTNWYGAIFASSTAIAGQVSFYIAADNIVVQSSGGPAIDSGYIVLEWISEA